MIQNLMTNPYIWLLLSICTVASILFAIYTWFASKRRKEMSYSCTSNTIISVGESGIDKLDILYDNQKITDLTSTMYYIWNSGNEVLHIADLVTSRPVRITTELTESLLDARILRISESSNNFVISNLESHRVDIAFDYVAPGEGFVLQLLHTGTFHALEFDCKIKGGNVPCNCSGDEYIKHKGVLDKIAKVLNDAVFMVSIVLTGLTAMLYDAADKITEVESKTQAIIPFLVGSCTMLGVVVLMKLLAWHMRHGSHHSIPKSLK